MPTVSRFFGIVIAIYYDDHAPPHFHAIYSGTWAAIRIEPVALLRGELPPRALGLVMEWARLHRRALMEDWERARRSEPLDPIPPLE
jgi:hypothetical protein